MDRVPETVCMIFTILLTKKWMMMEKKNSGVASTAGSTYKSVMNFNSYFSKIAIIDLKLVTLLTFDYNFKV